MAEAKANGKKEYRFELNGKPCAPSWWAARELSREGLRERERGMADQGHSLRDTVGRRFTIQQW